MIRYYRNRLFATVCVGFSIVLFATSLALSNNLIVDDEPIVPLASAPDYQEIVIELGRKLFHEEQLSGDYKTTCNSCHPIETSGSDNMIYSVGSDGFQTPVNTPTIYNSSIQFAFARNGKSRILQQMIESVLDGKAMKTNWPSALAYMNKKLDYRIGFANAFGEKPSKKGVMKALVAYVDTLRTPSRFDRFLTGDETAISAEEKEGYKLFKTLGCVACHQGMAVGGNLYQSIGVLEIFDYSTYNGSTADLGRYQQTMRPEDKYVFKVPSLRNVVLTGPYLHNGSVEELGDVISLMGRYQLGVKIPEDDISKIKAFLGSLTGEGL